MPVLAVCLLASAGQVEAACSALNAAGQNYTVCSFEPDKTRLEVFNLDYSGEPYRYFSALQRELSADGKTLRFAMNAGMFDTNQRPIGLYIEDGQQTKKLNRRNGGGNFHLKPNGVFFIKDGKPEVMETEAYMRANVRPEFASQSGPMLVVGGKIHPKFSPTGLSRKIRNGVGIDGDGVAHFVISDSAVTFYEFATLFSDELACDNALFFDGSISGLFAPEINRNDGFLPLGPMVGAYEIK